MQTRQKKVQLWFHPPDASFFWLFAGVNLNPYIKMGPVSVACPAVLLKKKKKEKSFVAFGVADPYLHNASRTNKTSSSGIVREAQREASTDMIFFLSLFLCFFFFYKSHENCRRCAGDPDGGRGGERLLSDGRENSAERCSKVRAQNKNQMTSWEWRAGPSGTLPAGETEQQRVNPPTLGQL